MIKVQDIVYVINRVPDLEKMERFLLDFGLVPARREANRLYMRGAGTYPYCQITEKGEPAFVAAGFLVGSEAELEEASHLPGASDIEIIDAPGGGTRVRMAGPSGHRIDLVHGIELVEPLPVRDPLKVNFAYTKQRVGDLQRPALEPARVVRLGHCVFKVGNADAAIEWFTQTLGMLVTDRMHIPDDQSKTLGTFLRCNRGSAPADHHTILCLQAQPDDIKVHHMSFEVQDPDAVHIGHYWMAERGWTAEWGVGRHLLGSQVFDYWRDPWGNMFEHYADGDLLTEDARPGDYPAIEKNLAQWGPEVSKTFFD